MARRRKRESEAPVNHERWLVSYADFITLLFAFFVVMFAVSQVDVAKMGRFTEAVQEATTNGVFDAKGTSAIFDGGNGVLPGQAAPSATDVKTGTAKPDQLGAIRERLTAGLADSISKNRISITQTNDGLVVRLRDAAFFDSASADVRGEMLSDLATVGATLRDVPNSVRIEGHTDSIPIHTSTYRSNWELSAGRAGSVLDYLVEKAGVDEARLSVAGYASQRPLADNATSEGRAQNRRVDIVVLDSGKSAESTGS
jgi:chemotaxis protein MotB